MSLLTRRGLMKGAITAGIAVAGAAAGAAGWRYYEEYLEPPHPTAMDPGFVYVSTGKRLWYSDLLGQDALSSHLLQQDNDGIGFGVVVLWNTMVDYRGRQVPGTGSPALIMRLDSHRMVFPDGLEEPISEDGFMAFFNTDPRLCCNAALNLAHTVMEQPPMNEDVLAHPNDTLSGLPLVAPDLGVIFDPCYHDQWDPSRLVWNAHPNGTRYIGANWVWGPVQRALPAIPLQIQKGKLVGLDSHPEWYKGYCGL